MDGKFKIAAGIIVAITAFYFYQKPKPVEHQVFPSHIQDKSTLDNVNQTSLLSEHVDRQHAVSNTQLAKLPTNNEHHLIDSLDKIPACDPDPNSEFMQQLQMAAEKATAELKEQWQQLKTSSKITVEQQIEFILHGENDSSTSSDKLFVLAEYLTKKPNDQLALITAIHLCAELTPIEVCNNTVTNYVQDLDNGYLHLSLAANKLRQKEYQQAEVLIEQAIKQPAYDNLHLTNMRSKEQFLAKYTSLPAGKLLILMENSNFKGNPLMTLHQECNLPQYQNLEEEACYQAALYISQSANTILDKMIGVAVLQAYHEDHSIESSIEENISSFRDYSEKAKNYGKFYSHALVEERLLPTFLSEAYDHSEQARMDALTEQLLDYYQDPNYNPCQTFNQ